jgi:hypothetical protein
MKKPTNKEEAKATYRDLIVKNGTRWSTANTADIELCRACHRFLTVQERLALTPDVRVQNEGSVFLFTTLSDTAREWVKENVQIEDFARLGLNTFGVEHRFAPGLAEKMQQAGLDVV